MICGDMDSTHPKVLDYYRGKGVKIIEDSDKYSTDLMKCLKYAGQAPQILAAKEQHERVDVAIFGGLGGRADQAFSQLHQLFTLADQESASWTGDFFLIIPESLMFLLEKGWNRIHTPIAKQIFTENIGIIPIGRPSIITTCGLEWDVTDWPTEFGGLLSTSNHIKADVVEVETTERVLFTLEFDRDSHQ